MRLTEFSIAGRPPIFRADASNLSNFVVIAGANGAGKTKLIETMKGILQSPQNQTHLKLILEATSAEEEKAWGQKQLDTRQQADANKLKQHLHQGRRRGKWRSSVIYFESDRRLEQLKPLQWAWEMPDPDEEVIGWNQTFQPMRQRWQDTFHALQRKVEHQKLSIANRAIQLREQGKDQMSLRFGDPLEEFKKVFERLLGPKTLANITGKSREPSYIDGGQQRLFRTLSSGEQQVVNIAFDFLLREPNDCIVFFDEPELHLHPELVQRLLSALQSIGERNQFIVTTHSSEVITASLRNTVVFLKPASRVEDGESQAVVVAPESDEMEVLGQTLGIVSLGKRIVLLEGEDSSADKLLYGAIAPDECSQLVLLPCGGREEITSFAALERMVLSRSVWGIDFFMLCDSDGIELTSRAAKDLQEQGRFRLLPRHHVENYFLDAETWAAAFSQVVLDPSSWMLDPKQIDERLRNLAQEMIPVAVAKAVDREFRKRAGNVSLPVKGADKLGLDGLIAVTKERAAHEAARVSAALAQEQLEVVARRRWTDLEASFQSDHWKTVFPGKLVFRRFARMAKLPSDHMMGLYVNQAKQSGNPMFEELRKIFQSFAQM